MVEDNADDVILIQRAFHGDVFKFEIASSGEEALKRLIHSPGPDDQLPSLILLDLSLPGMHGFDVIRALKNHGPTSGIPIVILTASNKEDDMVQSQKHGAIKFLRKPLTPLTVGEILSDCFD